jgi:exopolysaccharide production protein ExoY
MSTAIHLDTAAAPNASSQTLLPEVHWAAKNRRRHWARAAARMVVLGMSDLMAIVAVRALVRAVRDHVALGDRLSWLVNLLLGPGVLGGWHLAVALLISLAIVGSYGPRHRRRDNGGLLGAVALAALMTLYGQAWAQSAAVVALCLAVVLATVASALALSRAVMERLIDRVLPAVAPNRLVVVSSGANDWIDPAILAQGNSGTDARFRIVGSVGSKFRRATDGSSPSRALTELPWLIAQTHADTVLIAGPLSDLDFAFVRDTALANGCRLLAAPRTPRFAGLAPRALFERGTVLVELTAPAVHARHLAAKRLLDVCLSGLALVVLSPVFGIIALLVKLESPGPAIFGHWRLGAEGRLFRCYKFRSMRQDADRVLKADPRLFQLYVDNNYKLPGHLDPRVTRVGRFLRKSSLDELPQLFNVFLGHMSLVGPRPILPEELEQHYGDVAPLFLSRKPGLTGNWAANGRSEVAYPRRADLELDYVRQWSFANDVDLMLRTIPVVARCRGAQ